MNHNSINNVSVYKIMEMFYRTALIHIRHKVNHIPSTYLFFIVAASVVPKALQWPPFAYM